MSLDEGLKPEVEDINGLLGSLSAEDIKWFDLEFLDLASGPPATQDRNRNKNSAAGSTNYNNFPDIFFGGDFSAFDDLRPFGDLQLDLLGPPNEPEKNEPEKEQEKKSIIAEEEPPAKKIKPDNKEQFRFKQVIKDDKQESVKVLAQHGIKVEGGNDSSHDRRGSKILALSPRRVQKTFHATLEAQNSSLGSL